MRDVVFQGVLQNMRERLSWREPVDFSTAVHTPWVKLLFFYKQH